MKFVTDDRWTGQDKVLHFVGCFFITIIAAYVTGSLLIGVLLGVLVATLKDVVYDGVMKKGTFSLQDLVVSYLGVLLGYLFYPWIGPIAVFLMITLNDLSFINLR